MTQKHGKLLFLSALIFLFLTGGLVGATQEENKEKKKEPTKTNETSDPSAHDKGILGTEAGQPLPVVVKPLKGNFVTDDEVNMGMPGIEVAYVNGRPHGKAILRYKNGTRVEGEYNNGLKTGLWIIYDKQGRKYSQESYKDGKKDGKSIRWDEDGYVNETEFKDDLMHGKQCSWDKNGKLIYEHGFKNGKRHGRYVSWYPNGDKSKEGYFNEGTGKLSTWYLSGEISTEADFKNGKPYGKEIWWYESGQKKHEQTYNEEGKCIGKSTYWNRDGKVVREEEFDQNGQRLYYREYYKDGNLTFDNDRPVDKKNLVKKSFCVYNIQKR